MHGLYTYIWLIFLWNMLVKHTIHRSQGFWHGVATKNNAGEIQVKLPQVMTLWVLQIAYLFSNWVVKLQICLSFTPHLGKMNPWLNHQLVNDLLKLSKGMVFVGEYAGKLLCQQVTPNCGTGVHLAIFEIPEMFKLLESKHWKYIFSLNVREGFITNASAHNLLSCPKRPRVCFHVFSFRTTGNSTTTPCCGSKL